MKNAKRIFDKLVTEAIKDMQNQIVEKCEDLVEQETNRFLKENQRNDDYLLGTMANDIAALLIAYKVDDMVVRKVHKLIIDKNYWDVDYAIFTNSRGPIPEPVWTVNERLEMWREVVDEEKEYPDKSLETYVIPMGRRPKSSRG